MASSRYAGAKYGSGVKYGATSPTTMLWALEIDWDDDGIYDYFNDANRMIGLRIERGRNYLLSSGGDRFEPVGVGRASIILSNHDDRFNPYNAASPLYPDVAPGRFIRVRVREGANINTLFTGIIQNITPSGYGADPTVTIEAEDGLRWLQDTPATTGVYQNIYADTAIAAILADVQWPAIWGSSVQGGADVLDYWWARDRKAFEELVALADSELGRVWVDAAGALVFRNRQDDPASVLSIDQAQVEKTLSLSQPWEIQRNICRVTSNPIAASVLSDIWTNSGVLAIGAGETVELFAGFSGAAVGVITPAATTDYLAFRNSDGTGTNETASIAIAAEIFSESVGLTITNGAARVVYLTLLKVRGQLLESAPVSARAVSTGYDRHPRTLNLDLEWQQDANNPGAFAPQLLTILNTAPGLPTISIDTRPDIQFGPDLFDVITVSLAKLGISSNFRVGSISHEWTADTGQAVRTTWKLEPTWSYGYWIFDTGVLDSTPLGW
jgi:hypothetical protein